MRCMVILIYLFASTYALLNPTDCGLGTVDIDKNFGNSARITGGTIAKAGDWGWQVIFTENDEVICGGVLLDSLWVVTAGHCIKQIESNLINIIIKVGYHNREEPEKWSTVRKISKYFIHEKYDTPHQKQHDIGLVKLDHPIDPDYKEGKIIPGCVPMGHENFETGVGWITGFGVLFTGGSTSKYLRQVDVPVYSQKTCQARYEDIDVATQLCAGGPGLGKDGCEGDSGGPLSVRSDTGRWYVIGITSFGSRPCGQGGVYTRLDGFITWMNDIMGLN